MERVKTPGALHFQEYVKTLPHQWVLDHLIKKEEGTRRILSSSMVEETAREFTSRASLSERFLELSPELQLRCSLVYLMGGRGLSAPDFRSIDDALVRTFLVFAARDQAGNVRYFGFDEFEPHLRAYMANVLADAARLKDKAHIPPVLAWRPLNDVAIVCGMAFQKQLTRSRTGGLSRTALNLLKKLTHDPTVTGRSGSGAGDTGAGFLISFALKKSFLGAVESEYRLDQQCYKNWQSKGIKEQLRSLMDHAVNFSGHIRVDILKEMLAKSEAHWLSVSIVPEPDRKAFLNALKAFQFLGLLDLGKSGSDIRFASVPESHENPEYLLSEQHRPPIVIMPDFTTLLPQESSPSEIFSYFRMGNLVAFDKIYKGVVDKNSICNALSRGVEATYLRDWFVERQAPSNVITTVQEWIREFSRLYVSSNSILVSADERVTLQVSSFEPLRKHLEPVSAHAVFRIHPGSEQKVLDILTGLGFDPRTPGEQKVTLHCEEKTLESLLPRFEWEPVTEVSPVAEEAQPAMRGTKYGAELKALDLNEMVHVIDYAILTAQRVLIDYEGSPYIKQNVYTILPLNIQKGVEPMVEAEVPRTRTRKQFYLRKIKRIGVVSQ
ncbi:MAG: hypothetical protein ACLFVQ_11690 [Chitinispirillaceae bacterium]